MTLEDVKWWLIWKLVLKKKDVVPTPSHVRYIITCRPWIPWKLGLLKIFREAYIKQTSNTIYTIKDIKEENNERGTKSID